MDNEELERVADLLVRSIKGEAQSRLSQRQKWLWLCLNRDGCLALAANLLRFAIKLSSPDNAGRIQELQGIEQIHDAEDDLKIVLLRQAETVHKEAVKQSEGSARLRDRIALLGCGLTAFCFATIFVFGLVYLVQLISGKG